MVTHGDEYQWSSYNAGMIGNEKVIPDIYPCYLALGDSIKLHRSHFYTSTSLDAEM